MKFIYKCRLCGKLEDNLHIGDNSEESHSTAIVHLVNAIHENVKQTQAPKLLSIHTCGKNKTGISDLIGCEPD